MGDDAQEFSDGLFAASLNAMDVLAGYALSAMTTIDAIEHPLLRFYRLDQ